MLEDFTLEGYTPAAGFRLQKAMDKNQLWLMADESTGRAAPAYMIRWWFPQPNVVRLRVWRTVCSLHDDKIGKLPRVFIAQLLERYDVRLLPTNNAFWRGLGYWALENCRMISAGRDRIFTEEKLVYEFYHQRRLMTIRRKESDPLMRQMEPVMWALANR